MTNVTISDLKAIFNVAGGNGAVHLLPAALLLSATERRGASWPSKPTSRRPPQCAKPPDQPTRTRRPLAIAGSIATEDLSEEEIAAVEASGMEPGFEHLDAELEPAGTSVVEVGVDFARNLRARGDAAKGRPADKAFRDSLFDDS